MLLLALLIGVIAGLRAMTPRAAIAFAARYGGLSVGGTLAGALLIVRVA